MASNYEPNDTGILSALNPALEPVARARTVDDEYLSALKAVAGTLSIYDPSPRPSRRESPNTTTTTATADTNANADANAIANASEGLCLLL